MEQQSFSGGLACRICNILPNWEETNRISESVKGTFYQLMISGVWHPWLWSRRREVKHGTSHLGGWCTGGCCARIGCK